MKDLIELDFSNNSVNCFPTCIPVQIQTIYASNNRLFYSPLPFSILEGPGCLVNLVFLDLGFNQLEELPMEFGALISLKNLQINDNTLTAIPEAFNRLVNLQTLNMVSTI